MRIISKNKDYYDYLVGYYGLDNSMVYIRNVEYNITPEILIYNKNQLSQHTFSICNRFYIVYELNKTFYHTINELIELNEILAEQKIDRNFLSNIWWAPTRNVQAENKFHNENGSSKINKVLRQPVLMRVRSSLGKVIYTEIENKTFYDSNKKQESYWGIPLLYPFGFATWYPPEYMYQKIYEFISWTKDNPEIPNKQTDLEKLESHGFDKKISFRHRKMKK